MSHIADFVADQQSARTSTRPAGACKATIATEPATLDEKVYVTLPNFGNGVLQFGPCRWQARDGVSLPTRGDHALVIFDDDDAEPWVVAWWPFDT